MLLRIDGVRDEAAAQACRAARVEQVGFDFSWMRRGAISVGTAKGLAPLLGEVQAVGVFRDALHEDIGELASSVGLGAVELSGKEDPEFCRQLKAQLDLPVMKRLRIKGQSLDPSLVEEWEGVADALVLDLGDEMREDWLVAGLPLAEPPCYVRGCFDPDNVAQVLQALQPSGLIVSLGVRTGGRVTSGLVMALCASVRAATAGALGVVRSSEHPRAV
jgi:phosphoribosylanthranilate isomerase